jgi:hypothetical protein
MANNRPTSKAATQVTTHPGISSSDDQDMMGRVRCGSPNAC